MASATRSPYDHRCRRNAQGGLPVDGGGGAGGVVAERVGDHVRGGVGDAAAVAAPAGRGQARVAQRYGSRVAGRPPGQRDVS